MFPLFYSDTPAVPDAKIWKIIPMTTKPLLVVFITRTAGEWYVGKGEEKKTSSPFLAFLLPITACAPQGKGN